MDHTIPLDAHRDDKTVIFPQITVEGLRHLHHTDIEIRGIDDLRSAVGEFRIVRAIIPLHMEVERLGCQCRMQFTGLAIQARPVVVKDPIRHIRRLLHLCQQDAATDGMYPPRRQIEHIASLDLMVGQYLRNSAVGNTLIVLSHLNLPFETRIEMSALIGLDDIPHLRLAHLPMFTHRHLVVGMHLDTQVLLGIDEFHQQGQLTMVCLINLFAQDGLRLFVDHRHQIPSLPSAIADDARTRGHSTHLPTLPNRFIGRRQSLIRPELSSTPHHRMQVRFKQQRIKQRLIVH